MNEVLIKVDYYLLVVKLIKKKGKIMLYRKRIELLVKK